MDAEGAPPVTPDCCRQDNGVELLPLDAPFQLSCSPATVEPLALAVTPEANCPGAELEVGSGGPVGQEEGAAIPLCGEFSPPAEVWVGDGDSVVKGGHGGAKVDHPSEECPTSWDDPKPWPSLYT